MENKKFHFAPQCQADVLQRFTSFIDCDFDFKCDYVITNDSLKITSEKLNEKWLKWLKTIEEFDVTTKSYTHEDGRLLHEINIFIKDSLPW